MSRILDYIANYDDNLTIAQLKEAIKLKQIEVKEKETEEIERVKNTFSNVFVKELEDDTVFGKTLNIYKIKNFVREERTQEWDFIYYFKGDKISFSERNLSKRIFNPNRCGDSFTEKRLNKMIVISKEEYLKYEWEYEQLIKKLTYLIL